MNKATGAVSYTIATLQGTNSGGSGHYKINNNNVNLNVQGLLIGLGRNNNNAEHVSFAYIDDITIIRSANSIDTYAFGKPGTLSFTASAPGYRNKTVSFNVELPYVKDGSDYVPVSINDEK